MSFCAEELTLDCFLDGKIQMLQPRNGYRAATDPVYLAAASLAKSGQSVLELGCGAGVAMACLCYRVARLDAVGVEIQPEYAELAARNAAQNRLAYTVVLGDLAMMPDVVRLQNFDHVMMNPPFFEATAKTGPNDPGKNTAHMEGQADLADWIEIGLRRLKPKGWLSIIHLAERLPEMLTPLQAGVGNIHVLPIASRRGRAAKRVIILAQKGSAAPLQLLPPFVVHDGENHSDGHSDYSELARSILRDGAALRITAQ